MKQAPNGCLGKAEVPKCRGSDNMPFEWLLGMTGGRDG